MSALRNGRGDGIGLEFTRTTVRAVLVLAETPGRLKAAGEVRIEEWRDDRTILDALVRVRAELGGFAAPTRVAMFPSGSTMHRLDVTGRSGPELNGLRHTLDREQAVSSTVLVDDGPRRWLLALRWDDEFVVRVEELVERAGFVDVAIDPSPVALARVMPVGVAFARRDATTDEAFDVVVDGVPVAACSIDPIGRQSPGLSIGGAPIATTVFDGLVDPVDLAAQIGRSADRALSGQDDTVVRLRLADDEYPPFPVHDLRAPARQCVALGAALGAAGLSGRIRPIDVTVPVSSTDEGERPWAIERMSALPAKVLPRPVTPTKRFLGRVIPRRRN